MIVKGNEIVEKRNILNEVRKSNMTLQELRFFSIYLSKINARDTSTRTVRFPLKDFRKIMEFGRLNVSQLKDTTDSLLGKVVSVPLESGGYKSFQLFKECTVDKDEFDQWYVEIDAHDKALPLMFEFKREYFSYELWNALRLKSPNHLRMYELLKQYETIGERKITLLNLRELLGIAPNEYPRWDNFKRRIIDGSQEAIAENTDISFEYKLIKSGRKITGIHFFIKKNPKHVDQLSLDDFIDQQEIEDEDQLVEQIEERQRRDEICSGFSDEIFDEFTDEQLYELRALAWDKVDHDDVEIEEYRLGDLQSAKEFTVAKYIRIKILMCNSRGNKIKHRYNYIKTAVAENYQ